MKKQILILLLAVLSSQIVKSQCGTAVNYSYSSSESDFVPVFSNASGCVKKSIIQANSTNVGISTTPNASYKLDVAGAINASGKIYCGQGFDAGTYGITYAGAISGATTISASGAITGGSYSGGTISGTTITGSSTV